MRPDTQRMQKENDEARTLYRSIYARDSAGCCLHSELDDGNLEDHFFEREPPLEHDDCRALWRLLREMSVTRRRKIASTRSP